MASSSSIEELESSYKKALKSLEGEKRAAIKKAKGMKGKKGKEALVLVETEFTEKLKALETAQEENLAALYVGSIKVSVDLENNTEIDMAANSEPVVFDKEKMARERKLAKAKKKRDRQKEKEAQIHQQIEEENNNAGPSLRKIELEQIQAILTPLNLIIKEIEADGHCLYRAVAAQTGIGFMEIRALCADTLLKNREEFESFCEYTDDIPNFDQYLEKVRNSDLGEVEWGGHLELRSLGIALNRSIYVYSVQSGAKPLAIHEESGSKQTDNEPILLSYHLHYYALGEHYNQITAA